MKDAVLVHHQGSWVAFITLQDGRAAPFSLRQNLTPEEATSINALHCSVRIHKIVPLVHAPLTLDEDPSYAFKQS